MKNQNEDILFYTSGSIVNPITYAIETLDYVSSIIGHDEKVTFARLALVKYLQKSEFAIDKENEQIAESNNDEINNINQELHRLGTAIEDLKYNSEIDYYQDRYEKVLVKDVVEQIIKHLGLKIGYVKSTPGYIELMKEK